MHRPTLFALAVLWTFARASASAPAARGIGAELDLPNAGFEAGLSGWSAWSSSGAQGFVASALSGAATASAALPAGTTAELWRSLTLGSELRSGDKLELAARVWIDPSSGPGALSLRIQASNATQSVVIAASPAADASTLPRGRWLALHTEPWLAAGARVPAWATRIDLVLSSSVAGSVHFDDARAGRFEYAQFTLDDASFEDAGEVGWGWRRLGLVARNRPLLESDAYMGSRYAKLGGAALAVVSQALPLGELGAPEPGEELEGGAWVLVELDAALGNQPDPARAVAIEVRARGPGGAQLLAEARWTPVSSERDTWTFLRTAPSATPRVPFDAEQIELSISKSFAGTLRLDFVQMGERHAVHGLARKHVAANYVGRYRSPLYPGCTTSPIDPRQIWKNWCWITPPWCDASATWLAHDPECSSNAACVRANGRRDVAASTESSLDDLPLAGAYDSRDRDVLRYHAALARAIGIDSLIYTHQGHTLAAQVAAGGGEPINEQCFERLLDVAEEPGSELKIGVMYEPKVHLQGWVAGEPTLAQKLAGIQADLAHLVGVYGARKGLLRYDARPVVFVFRNNVCSGDGSQCLGDAHWDALVDAVELQTGVRPWLIADMPPSSGQAFAGAARWRLFESGFARYSTWSAFAAGIAAPAPASAVLEQFARANTALATTWAAADDTARVAVALAWPGFDDSGVAGWSNANQDGVDGQPLCVRVAHDFAGSFFDTTLAAALDARADWLELVTWNDWNERTEIEPRWNASWSQAVQAGLAPLTADSRRVFERAFAAQAAIADFKGLKLGVELCPSEIERVAAEYVRSTVTDPNIVRYD